MKFRKGYGIFLYTILWMYKNVIFWWKWFQRLINEKAIYIFFTMILNTIKVTKIWTKCNLWIPLAVYKPNLFHDISPLVPSAFVFSQVLRIDIVLKRHLNIFTRIPYIIIIKFILCTFQFSDKNWYISVLDHLAIYLYFQM